MCSPCLPPKAQSQQCLCDSDLSRGRGSNISKDRIMSSPSSTSGRYTEDKTNLYDEAKDSFLSSSRLTRATRRLEGFLEEVRRPYMDTVYDIIIYDTPLTVLSFSPSPSDGPGRGHDEGHELRTSQDHHVHTDSLVIRRGQPHPSKSPSADQSQAQDSFQLQFRI
ncbi:hypothetical protein WMY93_034172, partial [Mugilogobius chulae]